MQVPIQVPITFPPKTLLFAPKAFRVTTKKPDLIYLFQDIMHTLYEDYILLHETFKYNNSYKPSHEKDYFTTSHEYRIVRM